MRLGLRPNSKEEVCLGDPTIFPASFLISFLRQEQFWAWCKGHMAPALLQNNKATFQSGLS